MFRHSKFILNTGLLTVAALALAACVTTPYNDEWVDPNDVDFAGYAEEPGGTVEIQGRNTQTNAWVTITSVTASTTPFNYGGETLYSWSAPNVDTLFSGQCFWGTGASCTISAGSASAEFRVREVGGRVYTTFEDGGTVCVVNQVSAGTNWFTAAVNCASSETPVLTLRVLT
ncbi:MAG: hypothetical protein ACRBN8_24270 [Nannocystales bacterium]